MGGRPTLVSWVWVADSLHARYYNPNVARFLSVDNGNPKPRAPQTWNRYAYALGNPNSCQVSPSHHFGVGS